jgi:heat shock protein HslJ
MRSSLFASLLIASYGPAAAAPSPILGEWSVGQLNGAPIVQGSKATLRFDADGRVSGKGSCNRYGATYRVEKDRISFSPALSTRMACAPELMAQEALFFSIIQKAARWVLDGGVLIITAEDGSAIRAARAM